MFHLPLTCCFCMRAADSWDIFISSCITSWVTLLLLSSYLITSSCCCICICCCCCSSNSLCCCSSCCWKISSCCSCWNCICCWYSISCWYCCSDMTFSSETVLVPVRKVRHVIGVIGRVSCVSPLGVLYKCNLLMF